jgi:hypothetical protein
LRHDLAVVGLRLHRDHDAVHADVVADDAIAQRNEVELLRSGHARARDLAVEVDLRSRAELALEEPLETQQLLVSCSTSQVDFEQREIAIERDQLHAGRGACCEQERQEEGADLHGETCFVRIGNRR